MMFYETSAIEGLAVEEAFLSMAKAALKRDADQGIQMPPSIGEAGGAMKLNAAKSTRGQTQVKGNCC